LKRCTSKAKHKPNAPNVGAGFINQSFNTKPMARVITFSRHFPATHPSKGEKTRFVERIWSGLLPMFNRKLMHSWLDEHDGVLWDISYVDWLIKNQVPPKIHTIRKGCRFKKGDDFSFRVWSGNPYASKQVQFAPDLFVIDTPRFKTDGLHYYVNNERKWGQSSMLADNDGLLLADFAAWFPEPMEGQIILWHKNPY
jgi:hypothetical protein